MSLTQVVRKSRRTARAKARKETSGGAPRRADPDLGIRLRDFRRKRGLTQARLARPEFSPGFVSLVETGRAGLSVRAATVFAQRLGVDVTDLLSKRQARDLEFMLLQAEHELAAGRLAVATEIASKWAPRATGLLRARLRRVHGRALAETRSRDGVHLLDEALRLFRSAGATELVARTLFDLARAFARLDAPGEAVRYALEAEQGVQRGDLIDRTFELQLHQFLAAAYQALGDGSSAEIRAERARAMAEDGGDPRTLASLYQTMALTRYEQGDSEAALAYARKGLEAFEAVGHAVAVAETWNTIGWLFLQRGQLARAEQALDEAESLGVRLHLDRLQPWVQANRAAIALARGEHARARELAEAAAAADGSARMRSRALLVRARAIAASGVPAADVRRAFEEAIEAHRTESVRARAKVHEAFAEALAERGEPTSAYAEAREALSLVAARAF